MRYINQDRLEVDDKWLQEAFLALLESGEIESSSERKEFINSNSKIWRKLKPNLKKLSYGKCWYSEARNVGEDGHVDHFRPKNHSCSIDKGVINQDGYWWLAFDYRNYRFCCTHCNCIRIDGSESLGKGDYFPLLDESVAARDPHNDISLESPCLLDPTNRADVNLISFNNEGSVISISDIENVLTRVNVTIHLLHLNSNEFKEERKKIFTICNMYIGRINKLSLPKYQEDPLCQESFEDVIRDICKLTSPEAPFSSTAKECLRQSGYPWAISLADGLEE